MLTNDLHSVWHDARGGAAALRKTRLRQPPAQPGSAGWTGVHQTNGGPAGGPVEHPRGGARPAPAATDSAISARDAPHGNTTTTRPRREPRHTRRDQYAPPPARAPSPTGSGGQLTRSHQPGHARSRTNKPRSTPLRNQPETRATGEHARVEPSEPLHDTTTRTTSRITKTSNTGSKAGLDRGLKAPEARKQQLCQVNLGDPY